jgi:TPR repeat protein
VKYSELAADQNIAPAQFNYACCLEHGHGVALDLVNSAKYSRLAADENDARAQFNYANCFGRADGIAVDLVNSVKGKSRLPMGSPPGPCRDLI